MRGLGSTWGVIGLALVLMLSLPLRAWAHSLPTLPAAPTSSAADHMPCHAVAVDDALQDTAAPCAHGHGCAWCAACGASSMAAPAVPSCGRIPPAGHQPWVAAVALPAWSWAPTVPTPPPRHPA